MTDILAVVFGQVVAQAMTWLASVGGLAVAIPMLIRYLQNSDRFPWIDENSQTISRVLSVLGAILSASAIHYTFDQTTGRLVVEGLTSFSIGRILAEAVTQLGLQEVAYQWLLKRKR